MTVHLVIKQSAAPTSPAAASTGGPSVTSTATPAAAAPPPDIGQSPFGLSGFGGIPGLGNLGMGSANFMEMQQQMQRDLMNNPDMLRQVDILHSLVLRFTMITACRFWTTRSLKT